MSMGAVDHVGVGRKVRTMQPPIGVGDLRQIGEVGGWLVRRNGRCDEFGEHLSLGANLAFERNIGGQREAKVVLSVIERSWMCRFVSAGEY